MLPPSVRAEAYLFDIDGTLLNASGGVHYRAFIEATRRILGVDCSLEGIVLYGNTELGILRESATRAGVSRETLESNLASILAEMDAAVDGNRNHIRATVCAGIPELLHSLASQNKLLGVATGNLEHIGWAKVEVAGLRPHFAFGVFAEKDTRETRLAVFASARDEAKRRLGSAGRVCFVGDTPADIEAARALDCPIIAVATGIHPFESLAALKPTICLRTCEDLFPS